MFLSRCLFLVALLVAHAQALCTTNQKGSSTQHKDSFGTYNSYQQKFSVQLPVTASKCQPGHNQVGVYVQVCAEDNEYPTVEFRDNTDYVVDVQRASANSGLATVYSGVYCEYETKVSRTRAVLTAVAGPKKFYNN